MLIFQLESGGPGTKRALDCGAGIGRVTKYLLQKFFSTVDLVEQDKGFLSQAPNYLAGSTKVGEMYCSGIIEKCESNCRLRTELASRFARLHPSRRPVRRHLVPVGSRTPDGEGSRRILQAVQVGPSMNHFLYVKLFRACLKGKLNF